MTLDEEGASELITSVTGCDDVLVTVAASKPRPARSPTKKTLPGGTGEERAIQWPAPVASAVTTGSFECTLS